MIHNALNRISVAGMVCAGLFLATTANAVNVWFDEDFENFNTTGGPVALTSATPTTNGGSWIVGGTDTIQVISDPTGAGKGNVLEFSRSGSNGQVAGDAGTLTTNGAGLVVEFDIYINGGNLIQVLLADNVGHTRTNVYLQWRTTDFRRIFNDNGSNAQTDLTQNRWYGVTLTAHTWNQGADPSPTTFDLHVVDQSDNSVLVNQTGLPYNLSDTSSSDGLRYLTFRDLGLPDVFIDNLRMSEIPEPATAGLFAIGSMLMLFGRRRQLS